MTLLYGQCLTVSAAEALREDNLLFTTKSPGVIFDVLIHSLMNMNVS